MALAARVLVLVSLVAGVTVGRQAAAAMTVLFRNGDGATSTYYHQGNRVRIANATEKDPGMDCLVELTSKYNVLVYDDGKAYLDLGKMTAHARALLTPKDEARLRALVRRPVPATSLRALGKTRTVNGFRCEMYERTSAGRVIAEICFAPWGAGIGQEKEFAWIDAVGERLASNSLGALWRPPARATEKTPGLAVWTSSAKDDGTRHEWQVVSISREPLPAAMFSVPADYREVDRPLQPGEGPRKRPRAADASPRPSVARPHGARFAVVAAILLMFVLTVGLLIQAVVVHLAANVVMTEPRFASALLASIAVWVVSIMVELLHLWPPAGLAVDALAALAGIKLAYGAGAARTLVLFVVAAAMVAFARHLILLIFLPIFNGL